MKKTGFTLLELVVATGIFLVLLIILIGIYSRFSNTQRRDIVDQKLLDDVRFAVEVFNREARTAYGSTYELTDNKGHGVLMRNQNDVCVHFRFEEGRFQRAEHEGGEVCSIDDFAGVSYATLVSSGVDFGKDLKFDAVAAEVEDGRLLNQGFVTIFLGAKPVEVNTSPIILQSTVASRQLRPYVAP